MIQHNKIIKLSENLFVKISPNRNVFLVFLEHITKINAYYSTFVLYIVHRKLYSLINSTRTMSVK